VQISVISTAFVVPCSIVSLLDQAIALAVQVHAGQKDRYGEPYILHPLRVMLRMSTDIERIAAVLHDVVEDSPLSLDDLRTRGFPAEVVEIVDRLTKRGGEPYESLIARAASHPAARRIKLADLEDNMDVRRMRGVTAADALRLERYRAAWETLQDAHQR
jgi:(p)ppGpp synthase/HD superfamily hydrolase